MSISVIVTYYGEIDFLPDALDSIAGQTLPPDDVIVVNDGHYLSPESLVRHYGYRYIESTNQGLAAARNLALTHCSTDYYLPLDADDKLTSDCIAQFSQAISVYGTSSFYYSDIYLWQENVSHWRAKPFDINSLLHYNYISATICVPTIAWKNIGGYDSDFATVGGGEDWAFILSLYRIGIRGIYIPRPLFYRRIRQSMASQIDREKLLLLLRQKFADLYGEDNAS